MPGKRLFVLLVIALSLCSATTAGAEPAADGVVVGKPSAMRNLVPAGELEKTAYQQYTELKRSAAEKMPWPRTTIRN